MIKVYTNDLTIRNFYNHKKAIKALEKMNDKKELSVYGIKRMIAYIKYVKELYGIEVK